MPLVRDKAVCLRRLDYSETSQILSIFTRTHGVLRVIAKGAKRTTKAGSGKYDGGLDLLDVGDAVFIHAPEKEMSMLTEWSILRGNLAMRESLRAMYLGQYAAELVYTAFEEHDPHETVFDDLEALIAEVAGVRGEELALSFVLRLLFAAGLMPEFGRCAECGAEVSERGPGWFSPSRGGVVCGACRGVAMAGLRGGSGGARSAGGGPRVDFLPFDPRLARLCRMVGAIVLPRNYSSAPAPMLSLRLPRLTRVQTDPVHRVLAAHLREVTGREMRMTAYVVEPPRVPKRPTRRVTVPVPMGGSDEGDLARAVEGPGDEGPGDPKRTEGSQLVLADPHPHPPQGTAAPSPFQGEGMEGVGGAVVGESGADGVVARIGGSSGLDSPATHEPDARAPSIADRPADRPGEVEPVQVDAAHAAEPVPAGHLPTTPEHHDLTVPTDR